MFKFTVSVSKKATTQTFDYTINLYMISVLYEDESEEFGIARYSNGTFLTYLHYSQIQSIHQDNYNPQKEMYMSHRFGMPVYRLLLKQKGVWSVVCQGCGCDVH